MTRTVIGMAAAQVHVTFAPPLGPYFATVSLVPRPHPQNEERVWGHWCSDSWFRKLNNHMIICIGLYWSTCSHVMVRTTKKRPLMSPDPFLACVIGPGNETMPGMRHTPFHSPIFAPGAVLPGWFLQKSRNHRKVCISSYLP